MVLLFPSTADRTKHYSTTNGVYGDFYGTAIRVVKRPYDWHGECNRKIAEVTEQLKEANECLAGVDYSGAILDQGQRRPRGECCYGASLRGKPNCECRLRMPVCLSPTDFYKPEAPVEWYCGQPLRTCNENIGSKRYLSDPGPPTCCETARPLSCNENECVFAASPRACGQGQQQQQEPEYLEDHVNRYHPHLAPKPQVLPKILFGQSNRPTRGGAYVRAVGSAGGFGVGLNSEMVSSRSNSRSKKPGCWPTQSATRSVLPETSRYNFYRYFGCAGQGAKTSRDYQPKP